ncbi:hypothetical protein [Clostridium sp. DJ247]|uniref:hypothetical protein n=1 Tax=Clostridium sp. DJ247 TaxID=2726188 RepID=UPI00162383F8|nr:hypothetical protein [Clostridium sp. DJ247]MBC2579973.1 hypothetical protein [Clostridium sp. DJ247]
MDNNGINEYYTLKKYLIKNKANDFFSSFITLEKEEHFISFCDGYLCEIEFDDEEHYVKFFEILEIVNDNPYEFKELDNFGIMIDILTFEANKDLQNNNEKYIEINNIRFYYNPNEIEINNEIMDRLRNFPADDDEEGYYVVIDGSRLVIY